MPAWAQPRSYGWWKAAQRDAEGCAAAVCGPLRQRLRKIHLPILRAARSLDGLSWRVLLGRVGGGQYRLIRGLRSHDNDDNDDKGSSQ